MMTDKQALLYVADKIGIQAQYYVDTGDKKHLETLISYFQAGNVFIQRMETTNE